MLSKFIYTYFNCYFRFGYHRKVARNFNTHTLGITQQQFGKDIKKFGGKLSHQQLVHASPLYPIKKESL